MTNSEAVGRNVANIRRGQGLTLGDLSERLTDAGRPMSISAISKRENGELGVKVEDLCAFAAALGVEIDLLLADPLSAEDLRKLMAEAADLSAEAAKARDWMEDVKRRRSGVLQKLRLHGIAKDVNE